MLKANCKTGQVLCLTAEVEKSVRKTKLSTYGNLYEVPIVFKGGDPAPPSDRATLLRLHPSHRPYLRYLPPCGRVSNFG